MRVVQVAPSRVGPVQRIFSSDMPVSGGAAIAWNPILLDFNNSWNLKMWIIPFFALSAASEQSGSFLLVPQPEPLFCPQSPFCELHTPAEHTIRLQSELLAPC